ncbi:MAG: HAD-IIA family hydrolase [Acidimicrobiia bacterium]|nr:HAD-IIA family hydrolase [Acidimicrobiia bacterium]
MTLDDTPGTIVFDLDGVLYLDRQGVPGAGEALDRLRGEGWKLLFATNNSTKTASTVADHILERTGFAIEPSSAITSAASAGAYAAERYSSAVVLGSNGLVSTLQSYGLEIKGAGPADCVVVGLDIDLGYGDIDRASRAIRQGSAFVATNVDSTYPTPTGLAPGAGAIVAAVREASGVDPVVCGKPTARFLYLVQPKLVGPRIWMVGDRPETDIAMAHDAGWTSVLTLTGVITDPTEVPDRHRPDHIIDSVADLPDLVAGSRA